jgi:hypothetical protein
MEQHIPNSRQETSRSVNTAVSEARKINGTTLRYHLKYSPRPDATVVVDAGRRFKRVSLKPSVESMEIISDRFEDGSVCEFVRLMTDGRTCLKLIMPGPYDLLNIRRIGWLFRSRDNKYPNFWLPGLPAARIPIGASSECSFPDTGRSYPCRICCLGTPL